MLEIDWHDHECGIDQIPLGWFEKAGKTVREHRIVDPEWDEVGFALCEVDVKRNSVVLDYAADSCRRFNRSEWVYLGQLKIVFKDSARLTVNRVSWRPEDEKQFDDYGLTYSVSMAVDEDDVDLEGGSGKEGRLRLVRHLSRERDPRIVRRKKSAVLRNEGCLQCEACGFDFSIGYPGIGEEFCEVHHSVPLADYDEQRRTLLSDLHILCSNCHRMIHRTRPLETVADFRKRLRR